MLYSAKDLRTCSLLVKTQAHICRSMFSAWWCPQRIAYNTQTLLHKWFITFSLTQSRSVLKGQLHKIFFRQDRGGLRVKKNKKICMFVENVLNQWVKEPYRSLASYALKWQTKKTVDKWQNDKANCRYTPNKQTERKKAELWLIKEKKQETPMCHQKRTKSMSGGCMCTKEKVS